MLVRQIFENIKVRILTLSFPLKSFEFYIIVSSNLEMPKMIL